MNKQEENFSKLIKYKEFLARNNCPENLPDYDQQSYWDARFQLQHQEDYDWYVEWAAIRQLFMEFIPTSMKIMELGSGKSNILKEMNKEGYKNLIGSDFSWTLINQKRNEQRYLKKGIKWERVDVMKQWPNFDVDCIFQKATIDCLSNSEAKIVLENIYKSLKKNGYFIHITTAHPESRISMLKKWDVKVYQLPKIMIPVFSEIDDSKAYYLYICCK